MSSESTKKMDRLVEDVETSQQDIVLRKRIRWQDVRDKMTRQEFFTYQVQTEDSLNKARAYLFAILSMGMQSKTGRVEWGEGLLESIWDEIIAAAPSDLKVRVQQEIKAANYALEKGIFAQRPRVGNEYFELIWGTALLCASNNFEQVSAQWDEKLRKKKIQNTKFWREFVKTPEVRNELTNSAFWVSTAQNNLNMRLQWGTPGSWFYMRSLQKMINIDLAGSLIFGFHNSRAVVFHEIGHALFTMRENPLRTKPANAPTEGVYVYDKEHMPASLAQLHADLAQLEQEVEDRKKREGKKKTKVSEYRQLALLGKRIELRHQLWNAMEDNCVNRYAAFLGRRLDSEDMREILPYDFGLSLNFIQTIIVDKNKILGLRDMSKPKGFEEQDDEDSEEKKKIWEQYSTLMIAMNLPFFTNNGLFPNDKSGWDMMGFDVEKLPVPEGTNPQEELDAMIAKLDGNRDSLSFQQPLALNRMQNLTTSKDELGERRAKIAEELLQRYFDPLEEKLMAQIEKKLNEEFEKRRQENQEGDENEGENDGPSQDGQGQGKGKGSGKGKGQQSGQGQGGQQDELEDDEATDEQKKNQKKGGQSDGDNQDGGNGDGEEKDKSRNKRDQEGAEQDNQDQNGEDGDGQDADEGEDEEDGIDVEGLGRMPDPTQGRHHRDEDEQDNDADGQDADEDGQDSDPNGGTIEELMQERQKRIQEDAAAKEKAEAAAKQAMERSTKAGQGGRGYTLDELPIGDFSDYAARVAQLSPFIDMVRRQLEELRKQQIAEYLQHSPEESTLFSDLAHYNLDRKINLEMKKKDGKQDIEDAKLFDEEAIKPLPTDIDLVWMIDGSGSMNQRLQSGNTAFETAILTSVIMYEAAKQLGIKTHIIIWGPENPVVLAKPDDLPDEIGKRIDGIIKNPQSTGTALAPAIAMIPELIDAQPRRAVSAGFTHVGIFSDGDVYDGEVSKKLIDEFFKYCKLSTLDFGIVKKGENEMATLARALRNDRESGRLPHQTISVVQGFNPNYIASEIVTNLITSLKGSKSFIPRSGSAAARANAKKKQMRRAAVAMRAIKIP